MKKGVKTIWVPQQVNQFPIQKQETLMRSKRIDTQQQTFTEEFLDQKLNEQLQEFRSGFQSEPFSRQIRSNLRSKESGTNTDVNLEETSEVFNFVKGQKPSFPSSAIKKQHKDMTLADYSQQIRQSKQILKQLSERMFQLPQE